MEEEGGWGAPGVEDTTEGEETEEEEVSGGTWMGWEEDEEGGAGRAGGSEGGRDETRACGGEGWWERSARCVRWMLRLVWLPDLAWSCARSSLEAWRLDLLLPKL